MILEDALLARYDSLLLDLDGVVYVGEQAVPGAAETITTAAAHSVGIRYVTNNASRTPEEVAAHLVRLGLPASASQITTSAQAGARLLHDQIPAGSGVLAVGGAGVSAALSAVGLEPIDASHPEVAQADVAAVMQGFGKEVGWHDLARASFALSRGIPWVATNVDLTIPVEQGIAPGNGALVAAVETATKRTPQVAGKPFPEIMRFAAERVTGSEPLVVGDRLDTDIEGAVSANLPAAMVMTGVSGVLDLWRAEPHQRPHYLLADLADLLKPVPDLVWTSHGVSVGEAWARVEAGLLEVAGATVDAVWAAANLIWSQDREPSNVDDIAARFVTGP